MMVKKPLMLLMVGMVAAMSAPALAGPDWKGMTSTEWDYAVTPSNWENDPVDTYLTNIISIDIQDVNWYGGSYLPVIDAGDNTAFGLARVRNPGTILSQTGGEHRWMNGSGQSFGLNIYNGAVLDMSGGKHTADRIAIGGNGLYIGGMGAVPADDGDCTANVWGTAELRVQENPFIPDAYDLYVGTNSVIDIRDSGVLEVPLGLTSLVNGYETAGKIVAGEAGYVLSHATNATTLFVSAVAIPEPASLLLLGLGLGSLALVHRR